MSVDEWAKANGYEPLNSNNPDSVWIKPTVRSKHRCYECFRQITECTCDDFWSEVNGAY